MAKMVVALTDEEKGSLQWPGRTEVVEAMALLVTAKTAAQKAECAQNTLPDYSVSPDSVELESRDEAISPTIPWMAEEAPQAGGLTIVDRGRLFAAWEDKRRRLRDG